MRGYTREEAVALCARVREMSQSLVSTPDRMQCQQCRQESEGHVERAYMARRPGYLGCDLINRLWARTKRAHSDRATDS